VHQPFSRKHEEFRKPLQTAFALWRGEGGGPKAHELNNFDMSPIGVDLMRTSLLVTLVRTQLIRPLPVRFCYHLAESELTAGPAIRLEVPVLSLVESVIHDIVPATAVPGTHYAIVRCVGASFGIRTHH